MHYIIHRPFKSLSKGPEGHAPGLRDRQVHEEGAVYHGNFKMADPGAGDDGDVVFSTLVITLQKKMKQF